MNQNAHEQKRLIGYGYSIFLLATAVWCGAHVLLAPAGSDIALRGFVTWGLVVMIIAPAYYFLQVWPSAVRGTSWLVRDAAINALLLIIALLALLDLSLGSLFMSVRSAGVVAFVAAFAHPIVVDYPHSQHGHEHADPSPAPWYLPRVCLPIDWTAAAVVAVGLGLF